MDRTNRLGLSPFLSRFVYPYRTIPVVTVSAYHTVYPACSSNDQNVLTHKSSSSAMWAAIWDGLIGQDPLRASSSSWPNCSTPWLQLGLEFPRIHSETGNLNLRANVQARFFLPLPHSSQTEHRMLLHLHSSAREKIKLFLNPLPGGL